MSAPTVDSRPSTPLVADTVTLTTELSASLTVMPLTCKALPTVPAKAEGASTNVGAGAAVAEARD